MTRRTFIYRPATGSVSSPIRRHTAKIYQFPARVPVHAGVLRTDTQIDQPQQWAHSANMIEIAAAIFTFALWLVWRLRHAFSPSH